MHNEIRKIANGSTQSWKTFDTSTKLLSLAVIVFVVEGELRSVKLDKPICETPVCHVILIITFIFLNFDMTLN